MNGHNSVDSVTLATPTPAECGSGVAVTYGRARSPFGTCFVADTPHGICRLSFCGDDPDGFLSDLMRDWPRASLKRSDSHATRLAARIFRPASARSAFRLWVKGTAFQLAVWRALLRIPEGSTASYSKLARMIGRPGAARAVGTAVGANPIAFLIPCHRVIREDGALGGYRWGAACKRAILDRESAGMPA